MSKTLKSLAACLGMASLGQAKTLSQQQMDSPQMLSQQVAGYYHDDNNSFENDISFQDNPTHFVEIATNVVNYFNDGVWDGPCTPYTDTRFAALFDFVTFSCTSQWWGMFQVGDQYNTYFMLNNERAKHCREAWLSVEGDCSTGEQRIRLTDWDEARAVVFKADPRVVGDGVIPTSGGYSHLSAEFADTCTDQPFRFMSFRDGLATTTNVDFNDDNQMFNFAFKVDPVIENEIPRETCPQYFDDLKCECNCPECPAWITCEGLRTWSTEICQCDCPNRATTECQYPFEFDQDTCDCACPSYAQGACPGLGLRGDDCQCSCPAEPPAGSECAEGLVWNSGNWICGCACPLTQADCPVGSTVNSDTCQCECTSYKPWYVDCGEFGNWDGDNCRCECRVAHREPPTCGAGKSLYAGEGICDCVCDEISVCEDGADFDHETCSCGCPTQPINVYCGAYGRWDTQSCSCVCDAESRESANCQNLQTFDDDINVCNCMCYWTASLTCTDNTLLNWNTCECECQDYAPWDVPCNVNDGFASWDKDSCSCVCDASSEARAGCAGDSNFNSSNGVCDCECPINSSDCSIYSTFDSASCSCICPSEAPDRLSCDGLSRWDTGSCECICDATAETLANCPEDFIFNNHPSVCGCQCQLSQAACTKYEIFNESTCSCECPATHPDDMDCGKFTRWDSDQCNCICDMQSLAQSGCREENFDFDPCVCDCDESCNLDCGPDGILDPILCQCETRSCRKPYGLTCGEFGNWDTINCGCRCDAGSESDANCQGNTQFDANPFVCGCVCPSAQPADVTCRTNDEWDVASCGCVCPSEQPADVSCRTNEEWDVASCRCVCPTVKPADVDCGDIGNWNTATCECQCPDAFIGDTICFKDYERFDSQSCSCVCEVSDAKCEAENTYFSAKQDTCECQCDPEVISRANQNESVCPTSEEPVFDSSSCSCGCPLSDDVCASTPSAPTFVPQICQCLCLPKGCPFGQIFRPEVCDCVPDSNADVCSFLNPNYNPLYCEPNPINSSISLLGCRWFLIASTDTSYPLIDLATFLPYLDKEVDERLCFDENDVNRPLKKYNGSSIIPPGAYPAGRFNFYKTPYTDSDEVYWVQSKKRAEPDMCPENSWLSYDDDLCATDTATILQVSFEEKRFWQLKKSYDLQEDGPCVYYQVNAWDPVGQEGACSINDYKLDLLDRASTNLTALNNQTDVASEQCNFKFPEFEAGLTNGETYCKKNP